MKRSEMVNKIIEVMEELDYSIRKELVAKAILAMQMEAGMKPPKSGKIRKFCNNYDGEYYHHVYDWESEND